MLWGLSCLPLTAPQPASSLGSTKRLSVLSAAMPSTTGAASAATAGAAMCSSGWSIFSEAEGTAADSSSRPLPAEVNEGHGVLLHGCMVQVSMVQVSVVSMMPDQHGAGQRAQHGARSAWSAWCQVSMVSMMPNQISRQVNDHEMFTSKSAVSKFKPIDVRLYSYMLSEGQL